MNDEMQKAVDAWLRILDIAKSDGSLTPRTADFESIAKFIQDRSPAVAVEVFNVAQRLTTKGEAEAPKEKPAGQKLAKRFPRVVWTIHEKDERKVQWTCKWQKMLLRVDHSRDISGKVVFIGYINGEKVTENKLLAQVQSTVAARALERAQAAAH